MIILLCGNLSRKPYMFERQSTSDCAAIIQGYLSSPEARKARADGLFEFEVKRLLERHRIKFEFHRSSKLGKHRYFPDFALPSRAILGATGLSYKEYWKHYREKTRRYVEVGCRIYVVVPDRKREEFDRFHLVTLYLEEASIA